MVCRLCLKSTDVIFDIFDPNGTRGLLVWKILEEILELHLHKQDGLPALICSSCMRKTQDFKNFKMMCLESRLELLKESVHNEETEADECKPDVDELELTSSACDLESEEVTEHPMDFVDEMKLLTAVTSAMESTSDLVQSKDGESEDFTLVLEESGDEDEEDSSEASPNIKDVQRSVERPSASPPVEVEQQKSLCLSLKCAEKVTNMDVKLKDDDSLRDRAQEGGDDIDTLTDNNAERHESRAVSSAVVPERRSRRISKKSVQATSNSEGSKECSGDGSSSTLPRQKTRGGTLASNRRKRRVERLEETSKNVWYSVEREGDGEKRKVLNTHKFVKTFKCSHCEKLFAYKKSLSAHIKRHFEVHICEICGNTYKSKRVLKLHLLHVHGEKTFKCDICGNKFVSNSKLKEHKRVHIKGDKHMCRICNKTFKNSVSFKRHMHCHEVRENRQKEYACSVCGHKFNVPSLLAIHMRIHTKEKPFPCLTCGAHFSKKYNLEVHMKSQHTECGLNRVQCGKCGQSYSRIGNLKHHERVFHMGLKEFKCLLCRKEFTYKCNVMTHVRKNHS